MGPQQHIGQHEISIENDVIVCRYRGPLSLAEVAAIHGIIQAQLSVQPRLFQICDLRDMDGLSREVREWIAKWSKEHRLAGVVLFGGSLVMQVAATMIERVARLLYRSDTPPVYFCRSEAEARAWVERQRLAPPAVDEPKAAPRG